MCRPDFLDTQRLQLRNHLADLCFRHLKQVHPAADHVDVTAQLFLRSLGDLDHTRVRASSDEDQTLTGIHRQSLLDDLVAGWADHEHSPADLHRLRHGDDLCPEALRLSHQCFGTGGRQIDRHLAVLLQHGDQPACVVAVVVGDDGNLGSVGADVHLRHVLEENVSLGPCVEQDGLLGARDEATEAPVGLQGIVVGIVVVKHPDRNPGSLHRQHGARSE